VKIDNPVHELEADEADWKYNTRIFVNVGGPDSKDGLQSSIVGHCEGRIGRCELGEVGIARGGQPLVASVEVDKLGGRRRSRVGGRLVLGQVGGRHWQGGIGAKLPTRAAP